MGVRADLPTIIGRLTRLLLVALTALAVSAPLTSLELAGDASAQVTKKSSARGMAQVQRPHTYNRGNVSKSRPRNFVGETGMGMGMGRPYPPRPRPDGKRPPIIVIPGGPPPNLGAGGPPPPPTVQFRRRPGTGVPPANERRYVPDEVIVESAPGTPPQALDALAKRHRLARLETFTLGLTGTMITRWRILDRRPVPVVVRALEREGLALAVQPNYLATLQEAAAPPAAPPRLEQYAAAKIRLAEAHKLATGRKVPIAVIDSGADTSHPELAGGTVVGTFDAIGSGDTVHPHGTGIVGSITARDRLTGVAPAAQILLARAFGVTSKSSDGTTYAILRSLDWAASRGARIINMSFAGPSDPAIQRSLAAARARNIILIAAAGNAGPNSPPLFPAADPNVIAVTATDENDNLYRSANRGRHIAIAAPGVDLWLPAPGGEYRITTGTSFAAAEISGVVALMLERNPQLTPDAVRKTLIATARDLGPRGVDPLFGAGLVDVYRAVLSVAPPPAVTLGPTVDDR